MVLHAHRTVNARARPSLNSHVIPRLMCEWFDLKSSFGVDALKIGEDRYTFLIFEMYRGDKHFLRTLK